VPIGPNVDLIPPETIAGVTTEAPGQVWYLGGEPNVIAQGNTTPSEYAQVFHYYWTQIKGRDPTATLLSASILNWDFTCTGCGSSYQSGSSWARAFRDAYMARYGTEPPVDGWSIDAYPLTWDDLPMVDSGIVKNQITGLRTWLDSTSAQRDKPIWVTEIASHWGYPGYCIDRSGAYHRIGAALPAVDGQGYTCTDELIAEESDFGWAAMALYVADLVEWLRDQGPSLHIEKWFFYRSYTDITGRTQNWYAGLSFFDEPSIGAALTLVGDIYREYALADR